ncbi:MAG: class I adenylate-forming enzyme family protein [Halolamina sp.]
MNYLDFVEATERAFPDQVAVREGEKRWTYAELLDDVRAAANVLTTAGVEPGDAVLVMLPNTYQFVTATLGSLARQAVVVPMDTRFGRREVGALLDQVDPAAAVVSDAAGPVLAAAAETKELAVFGEDDDEEGNDDGGGDGVDEATNQWSAALAAADASYTIPETMGEREAVVLHTSGSTGVPKGAVHTHANLIAISDAAAVSYEVRPGDVFLAAMPLYHCTGLGTILGPTLKVGGELLLEESWEPERIRTAIAEHDVALFSGVPTMYRDWLSGPETQDVDTASMHTAVIGGADVTASLIRRSEELLGCPVLNGWGMTETFAGGLWENRHSERRLPTVGGLGGRLFEAKIVDRGTGEECPPGEPGELLVRGEAMMTGYLAHDGEWAGEWFHTGDYARLDEGFVSILDRVDTTIVTAGENVSPREIEATIEELSGVRDAVVVGKPDERKGEKPVAFVLRDGDAGLSEQVVKDHVLSELAAFKHPREVTFVDEFPRNSSGKVDRASLATRL